ncbi:MAG: DUF1554 domain-containing protein [Spirochaetes bacterium]|nr:DUF1554 domain-containing protein [Spirochaetota bacterium]
MTRTNINDACYNEEVKKEADATCAKTSASGGATTSQKYIFLSAASYNGNLGGIAGADAKCNADTAKPNGSTYKAHLYHGTGTIGSELSNLSANYDYKNASNVKIITGSSWVSSGVTSTLIQPISAASVSVWFGNSTDNCTNWTSSSSLVNSTTGDSSAQNSLYRQSNNLACNNLFRIYCVEN